MDRFVVKLVLRSEKDGWRVSGIFKNLRELDIRRS